ncbi:MAG TPA: metallophosphoesterase [Nocardioidaceae bacterium]|nr:metallophosphoesterase [Nocardioidaceae bacterium]
MTVIRRAVRSLAVVVLGLTVISARPAAGAKVTPADIETLSSETFAVIGDTPYSDIERAQFPSLIRHVNADTAVSMVLHAGDIKSGESLCDNAVYQDRVSLFNSFADPFVFTPGDNEWTDCHRVEMGRYLPTERLGYLRQVFYPQPGVTLGQYPVLVQTQASNPSYSSFRENVLFERAGAVFATVHVVGSNNGRARWQGLAGGDQPSTRKAEYQARDAANLAWVGAAFDRAEAAGAAGVVLLMHAEPEARTPYLAIRNRIVARAKAFGGKVLLIHGDEHRYEAETSYAGVANLTRLETFGTSASRWLQLTVDPGTSAVFSWVPRTVAP